MLKIRFKRGGRKKQPFYKIVVMDVRTKRDGKVLEELGFYNPIDKTFHINRERTIPVSYTHLTLPTILLV